MYLPCGWNPGERSPRLHSRRTTLSSEKCGVDGAKLEIEHQLPQSHAGPAVKARGEDLFESSGSGTHQNPLDSEAIRLPIWM